MKRKFIIIISIIAVCMFSIFVLPFLRWNIIKSESLNVWILDKTVPNEDYNEHKGIMWALNCSKINYEKSGEAFRYNTDYYGFFPAKNGQYSTSDIPQTVEDPDLIYLVDTYGVYKSDYLSNVSEEDSSELLYGGLGYSEITSIKNNLAGGNTVIGEFGIEDTTNSQDLKDIFQVSWSGWRGKYFADISKDAEVPGAIVRNYEKMTGNSWDFSGHGCILVSDSNQVIVLKEGKELGKNALSINFEKKYKDEFNVSSSVEFQQWFEIIASNDSAERVASFTFDLTDSGRQLLSEYGLSESFPAVVLYKGAQFTSYYFAGDFSDTDYSGKGWNYYGFSKLKGILSFGDNKMKFFWKCYVPMMQKIIDDIKVNSIMSKDQNISDTKYLARTMGSKFQILQNGQWEDFFSKGVNIGSSTPGKGFTEFVYDEDLYLQWFDLIWGMNSNSIRVYTLMPPQFYSALVYFNSQHPDSILWLYQEIWPDEDPVDRNYLKAEYDDAYESEIKNVIDAVHGNINIQKRQGRAYGLFSADVSPYIAGILVGRELEPEEVISTNDQNKGFLYNGTYLYSENNASPTEAWLAMNCDYVLKYENEKYGWQHPVGIVSWPTLDPMNHDSEWNISDDKSIEYNDKVSIDINNISTRDNLIAGLFGAYHIYPNYPDFMNNEESYSGYTDEEGVFRYGGYLKEFIEGQTKYPALVAEFGLATGMGNAHENPDGYSHGGLDETSQGKGIVRMMKSIMKEGYAGGLIFEWADEWAKKTWTTAPYTIPFERNPLWHNAVDPEQNYGIYAMESIEPKSENYSIDGDGILKKLFLSADETYLHLELELQGMVDLSNMKLIIGLDTYDRESGNMKYTQENAAVSSTGLEYVIEINGKDADILVQSGYNAANGKYSSYMSSDGVFEKMSLLTNKERVTRYGKTIDPVFQNLSVLRYGDLEDNSYYNWTINGDRLIIRIPWTRINFTDPSSMTVLRDSRKVTDPGLNELKTTVSEGILASGILLNKQNNELIASIGCKNTNSFKWEKWDIPSYRGRLKESYYIIRDYLK